VCMKNCMLVCQHRAAVGRCTKVGSVQRGAHLEVLDHVTGAGAQGAEVDDAPAALHQQHLVEALQKSRHDNPHCQVTGFH
jgi:hypothetical protein